MLKLVSLVLPALLGGFLGPWGPGPSKTGLTFVLPTVVERIVVVNGFIPVMKPRSELDLERPWELEPERETEKPEIATLRSERLLAVRPLSSSPDTEPA